MANVGGVIVAPETPSFSMHAQTNPVQPSQAQITIPMHHHQPSSQQQFFPVHHLALSQPQVMTTYQQPATTTSYYNQMPQVVSQAVQPQIEYFNENENNSLFDSSTAYIDDVLPTLKSLADSVLSLHKKMDYLLEHVLENPSGKAERLSVLSSHQESVGENDEDKFQIIGNEEQMAAFENKLENADYAAALVSRNAVVFRTLFGVTQILMVFFHISRPES